MFSAGNARGLRAVAGGPPDTFIVGAEDSAGRRIPHAGGVCSPHRFGV
jgi:hypothetical protein